jgi:hypothetical protein
LISGALGTRDRELFDLLHRWRDTVYEFNHRLDLTESLTFASNSADHLVELGISGVPSAGRRPSG